jgi:hypothetical protein
MSLDWMNDDGSKVETAKDDFKKLMNWTSPKDIDYIFLQHDTHYQTSW